MESENVWHARACQSLPNTQSNVDVLSSVASTCSESGSHKYDLLAKRQKSGNNKSRKKLCGMGLIFRADLCLPMFSGNNIWKKLKFTCVVLL
jgi:hypothetical protein